MVNINGISDASGQQIQFDDTNKNGLIDGAEFASKIKVGDTYKIFGVDVSGEQLQTWLNGSDMGAGEALDVQSFIVLATKANPTTDEQQKVIDQLTALKTSITELRKSAEGLDGKIAELNAKLAAMADKNTPDAVALKKEIQQLEKIRDLTTAELKMSEKQARKILDSLDGKTLTTPAASTKIADLKKLLEPSATAKAATAGADVDGGVGSDTPFLKAAQAGNGAAANAGGQPAGAAQKWGTPGGAGVYPKFDTASYMNSVMQQNAILSSMDSVGESQMKSQKMMMLFFYLARMAATGDLGAMYQFMQFITYVISKDKALQNIDMANKLIALQDMSRKNTQMLLDTDTSDPNKVNDFYKKMEEVKSNESAIAMSQKLISQMMEEMATAVEALTSTTQNMQQAHARLLRKVASSA